MGSRMRRRPGEKDGGKDTTRAGISQSATSARRRAISETRRLPPPKLRVNSPVPSSCTERIWAMRGSPLHREAKKLRRPSRLLNTRTYSRLSRLHRVATDCAGDTRQATIRLWLQQGGQASKNWCEQASNLTNLGPRRSPAVLAVGARAQISAMNLWARTATTRFCSRSGNGGCY